MEHGVCSKFDHTFKCWFVAWHEHFPVNRRCSLAQSQYFKDAHRDRIECVCMYFYRVSERICVGKSIYLSFEARVTISVEV